jgi:signal peptidase I
MPSPSTTPTTPTEGERPGARHRRAGRDVPRRRPFGRRPFRPTRWLVDGLLALGVLLAMTFLAGALGGYRVLLVSSGSMRPTLQVGDVVLSGSVAPADLRPGELVTFSDPALAGRSVTHRVVDVRRSGRSVTVTSRGDANLVAETWSVPSGSSVGRAVAHLRGPGVWLLRLRSGPVRAAGVMLLAVLLGGLGLRRIWARA